MTNDVSMKKAIFEDFYAHLVNFEIMVAMRVDGVSCTSDLMQNEFVKFAIGSKAAKDMVIDEEGIEVNITINRQHATCFFPWTSIVGIISEFFEFEQKFNPLENNSAKETTVVKQDTKIAEPLQEDGYFLKDTKVKHLKLVTKKEGIIAN